MSHRHNTHYTVSQEANLLQDLDNPDVIARSPSPEIEVEAPLNPFRAKDRDRQKPTTRRNNYNQKKNNTIAFAYESSMFDTNRDDHNSFEDDEINNNSSIGDDNLDSHTEHIATDPISTKEKLLHYFVEKFHPIWFVSTMGTGISSIILYNFPITSAQPVLKYFGLLLFFLNIFLFFLTNILLVLKYVVFGPRYSTSFSRLFHDPAESFFLGCQPMGFCTIINMIYYTTESLDNGSNWIYFVYALFWIDVALTLFSAWGLAYIMFAQMNLTNHSLNAVILLPVVPLTVIASTGQIILPGLPSDTWQLSQIVISFMLWANSIFMAVLFLAIYFQKLLLFKLPPKPAIFSVFIPIGVMGQGAFAILLIAANLKTMITENGISVILPNYPDSFSQDQLDILIIGIQLSCCAAGLFLLAMGLCLSIIGIMKVTSYGLFHQFSKAWWAMTFPMGTMSVGFTEMYKITDLIGFKIMGVIYAIVLICITLVCLIMSFFKEFPHAVWKDLLTPQKKSYHGNYDV